MTQGLLLPLPLRQFRPKLRSKYMFDKKLYSYDMCSYIIRLTASLLVLERPQALLGLFHCHTEKRRSYLLNLRSHLTGSRIRDCLVRTRTLSITLIFFFYGDLCTSFKRSTLADQRNKYDNVTDCTWKNTTMIRKITEYVPSYARLVQM